jgi:uncharacterized membrane protein YeaQ/YmgE (transglycosylase-associated protein family)
MSTVINTIYDASAELGYIQSIISLIVGIFIASVLLICAYSFLTTPVTTANTTAKVTSASCADVKQTNGKNTTTVFNCKLGISYTVDKVAYTGTIVETSPIRYVTGQDIAVNYNIKNPKDVKFGSINNQLVGSISSGVALFIISAVALNYYLTTHFKLFAAAEGAGTVYGVVRSL